MPEYCTCGAHLPPDAVFCHKCGRPQREILTPEIESNTYVAAPATPPSPRPEPLPLNFHNPIAVRIALVAAVVATVLSLLVPIVNWLAAGCFAAMFYCRKTGFRLNVGAGVKIGWITGLMAYGLYAIVFAAEQLPDALSGHLGKSILDQMKNSPFQDPATIQQMTKVVEADPGMVILFVLAALFVFVTCLSMVGGALGARIVGGQKSGA
jgi:hypothetical protein